VADADRATMIRHLLEGQSFSLCFLSSALFMPQRF
jgi:hypothetical protein